MHQEFARLGLIAFAVIFILSATSIFFIAEGYLFAIVVATALLVAKDSPHVVAI
jgi:hypothetical protein